MKINLKNPFEAMLRPLRDRIQCEDDLDSRCFITKAVLPPRPSLTRLGRHTTRLTHGEWA
jgi:hypothetical protein